MALKFTVPAPVAPSMRENPTAIRGVDSRPIAPAVRRCYLSTFTKPLPGCGQRCLDLQLHLTHWMLNDQSPRMKGNSCGKLPPAAILAIPNDGKPGVRKLQPNLMLSPSQRPHFKQ
jgi:hypothetical protein